MCYEACGAGYGVGAGGMKVEGADAILKGLEKAGEIPDVSFKSDKMKKYS